MECSINNLALLLLMKDLVIGQRLKAPNFSAFHWSRRGSLVSIGQYFVATRVIHYRKIDPGKYGRNLHIEFSRTIVLSVPALQHRKPVFRFTLCLL